MEISIIFRTFAVYCELKHKRLSNNNLTTNINSKTKHYEVQTFTIITSECAVRTVRRRHLCSVEGCKL